MLTIDLETRFCYHAPNPEKVVAHQSMRSECLRFANMLNDLLPEGREKALAITHLEEVMMWANAAIVRN